MNRNRRLGAWLGLTLFTATAVARAEIRPSFFLDQNAWLATDIVVAREGATIDGDLFVLEVWKGDLTPGEALSIPELASFAEAQARIAYPFPGIESVDDPAVIVSGWRMILFLKDMTAEDGTPEGGMPEDVTPEDRPPTEVPQWQPATEFGGMQTSVVWIEADHTYSFIQAINPGPSRLMRHVKSEGEMKERIFELRQIQEALELIVADPDPERRAQQAGAYVLSDIYLARAEAWRILGECGPPALPLLRSMLEDPLYLPQSGELIDAMAMAGGRDIARELTEILDQELELWKARAPSLKEGWWNDHPSSTDIAEWRARYSRSLHILYRLREMHYAGSREPVLAFRDYWQSMPQLRENGSRQMIRASDVLLRILATSNQ